MYVLRRHAILRYIYLYMQIFPRGRGSAHVDNHLKLVQICFQNYIKPIVDTPASCPYSKDIPAVISYLGNIMRMICLFTKVN